MWALSELLVSFAASFLAYINSLDGDFVFDDHRAILTNNDLDPGKTSVWELLQNDFWGGRMSRVESHKSYRPLTVLTYRYFNYYFTELRPFSYHLVNILMHCVASVLFLFVSKVIFGGKSQWPVFAALLFAVHSIHTEVVASVVGRAEVVSCIFLLLASLLYAKAISIGSGGSIVSSPRTKWLYVLGSVALSVCAMLSKEQGITALGICASFDVLLHWETLQRGLWKILPARASVTKVSLKSNTSCAGSNVSRSEMNNGLETSKAAGKAKCKSSLSSYTKEHDSSLTGSALGVKWRLVVLIVSGLLLLWFRISMNHNSDPIFKSEELKAAFHPNRSVRVMSFSNIYTINAWLLLAPSSLCCDWSLGSVPLVTSIADIRNVWSIVLYTGLLTLVLHALRPRRDRFQVGMALAFLLLPFVPASGIVFKVGFVIAERVLYMPSLGSCLLITLGMRRLSVYIHSKGLKGIFNAFVIFLVFIMAIKTFRRNMDWASDIKLFESGVRVNPDNVKLHNNYGMELKAAGRIQEARNQYKLAMEIDPDYGEVYFNYGNLLSDEGEYEAAAASFEKAIQYPQMYAKTLNNLATMHFRLGHWKQAEERFKESLQLTPDQATTYNNLASLYGETKRYKESEEMFRKALELHPTYVEAYFNLGTLLFQMGRVEEAESSLKHALTLQPNHYGAANNLKVVQHHKLKMQQQKQTVA